MGYKLGYLSADIICSKNRTVFREQSSRKTVSYEEQIMSKDKYPSMFSPQMETIVFIILQIFFATPAIFKVGEYSRIFPSFSWGIFGHVTCLDQSRTSEKIWWIIRSNFTLSYIWKNTLCSSRKYPYSPTEGIGISWGMGSARPKNLKKCMKLNWNFQRGWGVFSSVGEVWIFSGITQYT